MTDLDRIRGTRDAAVVKRLSHRVEPTYGFILYGILYFFLSMLGATGGGLLGILLANLIGLGKQSVAFSLLTLGLSLVVWALAWWPFFAWIRRKRSNARSLVREGELCDATVATSKTDRAAQIALKLAMGLASSPPNVHWERVVFEYRGKKYAGVAPFDSHPAQGAACHVLFHPLAKFSLAFSPAGRAFVTKTHAVA